VKHSKIFENWSETFENIQVFNADYTDYAEEFLDRITGLRGICF
jgi:hypothetical protein